MNIGLAILHLKPEAISGRDYLVSNDGDGDRLDFWNTATLGARPTDQQLATAAASYLAQKASDDAAEATAQAKEAELITKLATTNPTDVELRGIVRRLIMEVRRLRARL